MSKIVKFFIFLFLFNIICYSQIPNNYSTTPEWSKNAIWYQIFPERFSNGDKNNDPTIETLDDTWPYDKQEKWNVTPWTSDWYKLQPWEKHNEQGFYYNAQLRRYGGDIQGVIDKLDYLKDLGVNALYLNPIFESPSLHKYGAVYYHHVDNNFGPDPDADIKLIESEKPGISSTWKWTSADKLFLKLIKEAHSRDMKIIIDGVFNHVGIPFWAFQDVHKNGKSSKYNDWFIIENYDDPTTIKDEFKYHGWFNVQDLPEILEKENGACQSFRDHIKDIVERWGDPDGDGNPEDGIDGWRLDVADMVADDFWRDFRIWVRDVNPEAYLTGEVWWEDYSVNEMKDATNWLKGDIFDANMNYRFGDAMLKSFVNDKEQITPKELDDLLGFMRENYREPNQYALMNCLGTHDTERFASMLVNPDRWIDHGGNVKDDKNFLVQKPNADQINIQKTILAFQFTYLGAPFIYYGDEVGMWGADDPDCRKPMVWAEKQYEIETTHPHNVKRPKDKVEVNSDLLQYYKDVISLRNDHEALRTGKYETILTGNKKGFFAYRRWTDNENIIMLFNLSSEDRKIPFKKLFKDDQSEWELIFSNNCEKKMLGAKSVVIYKKR